MSDCPTVQLNKNLRIHHPWVFGRLLDKPSERIPPGTIVDAMNPDGTFAGRGFYNARARIGLRVLTTDQSEVVDAAFFAARIGQAVAWRREQGLLQPRCGVRLVHAEGDGLSGLVVDLFDDVLAIQFFSAGMFRQREVIKAALLELFPAARVYWFAEKRVQKQESFDCWEMEAPSSVVIEEHGVKFQVAVGSKHKTGFFADQRDNRRLLSELCAGKSVADLCCHSGGFALFAKVKGQASRVVGVDLDAEEALPTARANAALNGADIEFVAADVMDWLRDAAKSKTTYDVVILDPAKQTRSADKVDEALNDYYHMNRLAMPVVARGGILLSCSCSGLITEEQFLGVIKQAARDSGRQAQVFRLSGAGTDHPFMAHVPEGRYLKAVWCRIT